MRHRRPQPGLPCSPAEPLFRVTRHHGGRVVREYGVHPRELAEWIAQLAIERHPDADYVMCEPVKETT